MIFRNRINKTKYSEFRAKTYYDNLTAAVQYTRISAASDRSNLWSAGNTKGHFRTHSIPVGPPNWAYDCSPGTRTAIDALEDSLRVPRPYVTELSSARVPNVIYGLTSRPGFSCNGFSSSTVVIWSNTSRLIYFLISRIFFFFCRRVGFVTMDNHIVVACHLSTLSRTFLVPTNDSKWVQCSRHTSKDFR
jgi:hypothetical protein